MKVEIENTNPDFTVPDFDHVSIAAHSYDAIIDQFGIARRDWTLKLIFCPNGGWIKPEGIYLPYKFASLGVSEQQSYSVFLKHEMVHYVLQILEQINPAPTVFINEAMAQSQAEGAVLKEHFGFNYHQLVAAAIERDKYVEMERILDNETFLRLRMKSGPVSAQNASFQEWIIDQFGMDKAIEVFRVSDGRKEDSAQATKEAYEGTLDMPFSELEGSWLEAIKGVECPAATEWVGRWS